VSIQKKKRETDFMSFKIGDSVIVKAGTKDPDFVDIELGGWQGRVIEIDNEVDNINSLIMIEWDSLTLKQLPTDFIHKSNIEFLNWRLMNLAESDLDKTIPRDKKSDVKKTQDFISNNYFVTSLGEQGLRIAEILEGVDPNNELICLEKWLNHLDNKLTFPIHAVVIESEGISYINYDDKVLIKSLNDFDDLCGIIANIKFKGKKIEFPLCDLEVVDKYIADYQLIEDYRTWFGSI
jgi:hypothetical protein